jgi:hypothetical protein
VNSLLATCVFPTCCRLILAAMIILGDFPVLRAQSLSGLRIGDEFSTASIGIKPVAQEQSGSFVITKWRFANDNELSVTARGGRIVFMELDWGGHQKGAQSDFPGLLFGKTTRAEVLDRFGPGITFSDRSGVSVTKDGMALESSYEVGSVILNLVTKVNAIDSPAVKVESEKGIPAVQKYARLVAMILAAPEYARVMWGNAISGPNSKKIEWK